MGSTTETGKLSGFIIFLAFNIIITEDIYNEGIISIGSGLRLSDPGFLRKFLDNKK